MMINRCVKSKRIYRDRERIVSKELTNSPNDHDQFSMHSIYISPRRKKKIYDCIKSPHRRIKHIVRIENGSIERRNKNHAITKKKSIRYRKSVGVCQFIGQRINHSLYKMNENKNKKKLPRQHKNNIHKKCTPNA